MLFCTQLLMFSRNSGGNRLRVDDSRPVRPVAAMLGRSVWTNRRRFTASTSERRLAKSWDSRLSLRVSWDGEYMHIDMLRLSKIGHGDKTERDGHDVAHTHEIDDHESRRPCQNTYPSLAGSSWLVGFQLKIYFVYPHLTQQERKDSNAELQLRGHERNMSRQLGSDDTKHQCWYLEATNIG